MFDISPDITIGSDLISATQGVFVHGPQTLDAFSLQMNAFLRDTEKENLTSSID